MKNQQNLQTFKSDVNRIIRGISHFLKQDHNGLYAQHKKVILDLFSKTKFDKEGIMLRLTVIDSIHK